MEEDKEVEYDGGLCAADSFVLLTLAGRGRRTERNINVFSTHVERSEPGQVLQVLNSV